MPGGLWPNTANYKQLLTNLNNEQAVSMKLNTNNIPFLKFEYIIYSVRYFVNNKLNLAILDIE
jgi:hypothetical protein